MCEIGHLKWLPTYLGPRALSVVVGVQYYNINIIIEDKDRARVMDEVGDDSKQPYVQGHSTLNCSKS